MSIFSARVVRIEKRCGASAAVNSIVRNIQRASNEQLARMNESGELARMAKRLSERELQQLVEQCKAMLVNEDHRRHAR